jgi:hypothetical protein
MLLIQLSGSAGACGSGRAAPDDRARLKMAEYPGNMLKASHVRMRGL